MAEIGGIGGVAGLNKKPKPRRNWSGFWWCLFGLMLGLGLGTPLGWFGPKILNRIQRETQKEPKASPTPVVVRNTGRLELLQIQAQPTQRGLQLSSPLPLQLLKPSESKRAQQRGKGIFSGFRDWSGTSNYLVKGQGEFVLKAPDGSDLKTNWETRDYHTFIGGGILQAAIPVSQPHTLYFQRKGQRGIDLGTFRINVPAPKPAKTAKSAAARSGSKGAPASKTENGKSR